MSKATINKTLLFPGITNVKSADTSAKAKKDAGKEIDKIESTVLSLEEVLDKIRKDKGNKANKKEKTKIKHEDDAEKEVNIYNLNSSLVITATEDNILHIKEALQAFFGTLNMSSKIRLQGGIFIDQIDPDTNI